MKKPLIIIIGLATITLGFLAIPNKTRSETQLTYSSATSCREAWTNGVDALESGWFANVQNMVNQEKATSEVVDDAYESLRTYRCWLENLCKSVQWSGNQKVTEVLAQNLSSARTLGSFALGSTVGCIDAEDMELPSTWADFQDSISNYILYKPPAEAGKFNMIPQCVEGSFAPTTADFIRGSNEFQNCKNYVEKRFAQSGVTKLENALFTAAAEKKARAVESKIIDITRRLQGSQTKAELFKQNFTEFSNRLPCVLESCT